MEKITTMILTGLTLAVAFLTFLATSRSWFKRTIPLQFGFLLDGKIMNMLEVTTGDPAKLIFLRFHNPEKMTLTGVELDGSCVVSVH